MFIKLCGFTRIEDINIVKNLPVSAVGFIFHKPSKRYIEPGRVRPLSGILKDHGIKTVGVFVDDPADSIMECIRTADLDIAQVYSGETAALLAGSVSVIRCLRIGGEDITLPEPPAGGMILFDTYSETAQGGTGKSFNHELIISYPDPGRMIVAGGLNENNIRKTILNLRPGGVDISSGIEISEGIKSKEKILNIMRLIAEAENDINA